MEENCLERMQRIDGKRKIADFIVKQKQDYEFKKKYAIKRIFEFVSECEKRDLNYHVSIGGLDSITLYLFLWSLGIKVKGISVSYLEDGSIQHVHKFLGIKRLKQGKRPDGRPWNKINVIREFGFPVLSKEIASKIETLANPTEKNKTVRHAIMTGETGAYGGNQKNSRMKMSQKWLNKFGGYQNEEEGTNYEKPDFKVSSKCCYYLKEKPCDDYAKDNNSVPFLGLMASEGGRRSKSLMINGCNYFGKSTIRSAPFAIFNRQDILQLALEMEAWYQEHWELFEQSYIDNNETSNGFNKLETIIPSIYGTIKENRDGELYTTDAQRTGCSMCGFGIHLEKRPHRFDKVRKRNIKEWNFLMYELYEDELTGEKYDWGKVLDYIGVGWRDLPPENELDAEQIELIDYLKENFNQSENNNSIEIAKPGSRRISDEQKHETTAI